MESNLLRGSLVRLAADEPAMLGEALARWHIDSGYLRLLDADPTNCFSAKQFTEWIMKDQEKDPPPFYLVSVRTLKDDRLIGFIGLDRDVYPHGDAFVGIGIGERDFWGKGYSTDAMEVILRYAFLELNLRRVSLDTFEYIPRAIHSYEKVGFIHEGRARKFLLREGRRWDLFFWAILRDEGLVRNGI